MQDILYNYTKNDGIQTILISQSSDCYDKLPRREFKLKFNNGICSLDSVEDFDLDFIPSFNDNTDDSDELESDGDYSVFQDL